VRNERNEVAEEPESKGSLQLLDILSVGAAGGDVSRQIFIFWPTITSILKCDLIHFHAPLT